LHEGAVMDWKRWTQQFHYGAIRNNNSRMFKLLGPDIGFDSIGDFTVAKAMSRFLINWTKTTNWLKPLFTTSTQKTMIWWQP